MLGFEEHVLTAPTYTHSELSQRPACVFAVAFKYNYNVCVCVCVACKNHSKRDLVN